MGYTHYFKQVKEVPQNIWDNFSKDVFKIIRHIEDVEKIELTSDSESGVKVNGERVNINGVNGCETFYLPRNDLEFNFCKTGRHNYDLAVCSILLLANESCPGYYEISSDGEFEDWKGAMKLNAGLLGKAFRLPESLRCDESNRFEESIEIKLGELNANVNKSKVNKFKI